MSSTPPPRPLRFVFVDASGKTRKDMDAEYFKDKADAARMAFARPKQQQTRSKPKSDIRARRNLVTSESDVLDRIILSQTPTPSLYKGDSDPFACYAIQITPHINQALAFMRDVFFSGMHNSHRLMGEVDGGGYREPSLGNYFWQNTLQALYAEGPALACLASHFGMMSIFISGSARLNALQIGLAMSIKSSGLLRRSLKKEHGSSGLFQENLFAHINFLHRASMLLDDQASNHIYGTMLRGLLIAGMEARTIDQGTLLYAAVVYLDAAAKFFCRTPFDYTWFEHIFAPQWNAVETILPADSQDTVDGLHETVRRKQLRHLFIISRHMNTYAENPGLLLAWTTDTSRKRSIWAWFTTKSMWVIGVALELFFDLTDCVYPETGFSIGHQSTQAALSLTLVFQFRSMAHGTKIYGVGIRDHSATIMMHLRRVMTDVFASCTSQELEEYADAHLWILFMGAFWERRNRGTSSTEGEPDWFQQQLVEKALLRKKATWAKLEPTLKRFAYSSWEEPNGAEWFDDVAQDLLLSTRLRLEAEIVRARDRFYEYKTHCV